MSELELASLALQANRYHAEAESSARNTVEAAQHAGQALIAAKAQCGHGQWLRWLKENCPDIADRTARTYMDIASNWSHGTDLPPSINDARKAISAKKKQADKPDDPPPPPVSDDTTSGSSILCETGDHTFPAAVRLLKKNIGNITAAYDLNLNQVDQLEALFNKELRALQRRRKELLK